MPTLFAEILASRMPAVASGLLEGTLKGGVILVLGAGVTRGMRARSAAARHLVWAIALVSAATMPLATSLLPPWNVALPVGLASNVTWPAAVVQRTPNTNTPATVRLPASQSPSEETTRSLADRGSLPMPSGSPHALTSTKHDAPRSLVPSLMLCWLFGAGVLLLRLLASLIRVAAVTRRAERVHDPHLLMLLHDSARSLGLKRGVRLLVSDEIHVPMTWGVMHPVVLLTTDYGEWSVERRRSVLGHELAHVARWDAATHFAAQVCCALYWFNPLVWIAARALRGESERACDDRVLAAGARAADYAGELLEIARAALGVERHGVAVAMARRSQIEGRLMSILDPRVRREVPGAVSAAMLGVAALALTVPLAAFRRAPPLVRPTQVAVAPDASSPRAEQVAPSPVAASRAPAVSSQPLARPIEVATLCQGGNHSSTHSNVDSDNSAGNSWHVSWSGDGCSADLRLRGDVKFNSDFSDIIAISAGGDLEINERENRTIHRLEIGSEGGEVRRTYSVNETPAPYDDAARAWLAEFLIGVDRHTGFAVDARLPALLTRGGTSAVLDEMDNFGSDYVRGVYIQRLLASVKLSDSDVRRVVKTAGAAMTTDHELGRLLVALAEQYSLGDAELRSAFIAAAGKLESDYEKGRVLNKIVTSGRLPKESLIRVLDLTRQMSSDHDIANVLVELAARNTLDGDVRDAYLKAASRLRSDYDSQRALDALRKTRK